MPRTDPGIGPRAARTWYLISEAAVRADVTERTIRQWQTDGLLHPRKDRHGRNEYNGAELATAEAIQRGKRRRRYRRKGRPR